TGWSRRHNSRRKRNCILPLQHTNHQLCVNRRNRRAGRCKRRTGRAAECWGHWWTMMRFRSLASLVVLLAVPACATTVTLNGTPYTLVGHPRTLIDGPGGVIDTAIKDPDGAGSMTAPKANGGNPAWVALGNSVTTPLTDYTTNTSRWNYGIGVQVLQFASYWYGDNSQTASKTAALYMLNNVELYLPLVCVETITECVNNGNGYGLTSYGISSWMPNWILAYELMRASMTTLQRQTFADKILNDLSVWGGINGASGTSCTNPTIDDGVTAVIGYPTWTQAGGT